MNTSGTKAPRIRYLPIFGGIFGKSGEYVLGTMACLERGLHAVRYMVLHPSTGGVLAVATEKGEALTQARRVLKAAATLASANEESFEQRALWSEADLPAAAPARKPRVVSKRRREVFEKSDGQCFYCGKVLALDGRWHIEHQMPRALMGPDDLVNLVAACAPCNLAKGDKTALEFLADRPLVANGR